MPITGAGSAFAHAPETVYGTAVTTTTVIPFESEGIATDVQLVNPDVMWPGQLVMPDDNMRLGLITHEGPVPMLMWTVGQEEIWRAAFGGYSFLTDTHTFTPAEYDESLTLAFGMGGDTSVPTKTYDGCIVNGWTLDIQADEPATFTIDVVAQGLTNADSGTIAGTIPSGITAINWTDVTVLTLDGQAFDCVRGVTITATPNYTTGRACVGSSEINDPRSSTKLDFTGVLRVEFEDLVAGTPTVVADFLSGAAATAFALTIVNGTATYTFTGQARVTGGNAVPNIEGVDILEFDVPIMFTSDIGDDTAALQMTLNNGTTTL